MISKALTAVIATTLMFTPAAGLAQQKPVTLSSDVKLVRIIDNAEQGEGPTTELVDPVTVVPGDTLAFTISYRNAGGESVTDFVIVNPVPANMRLTAESAAATEVSVDGGQSWGMLDTLTLALEEGGQRPATAEDVTHLRWKIALLTPGENGSTWFRAIVR